MNMEEQQYLNLMQHILNVGEERGDRTGTGTKSIFGAQLRFSLRDGTLPLLTTKKMFWKGIVEELLFFIRGETDTKKLEEKGVKIWNGNTSRDFLDNHNLNWLPEGHMGKGYGFQWRHFGGDFNVDNPMEVQFDLGGTDQLKQVVNSIKKDPFGRRHIISAWNPQQLHETALPPCHYTFQFYVGRDKELSCLFNMRSTDLFLGAPFNIASYGLFTHIMAQATGLKAKEVIFSGGDTHLYLNHTDAVKEQLKRAPCLFPKIKINKQINSVEDMEKLVFEDFELVEYQSYPAIKAPMAV